MPTPSARLGRAIHTILDHLQNGETDAIPLDRILLSYAPEIAAVERLALAISLASHIPEYEHLPLRRVQIH